MSQVSASIPFLEEEIFFCNDALWIFVENETKQISYYFFSQRNEHTFTSTHGNATITGLWYLFFFYFVNSSARDWRQQQEK
jgi:hypothetical protein